MIKFQSRANFSKKGTLLMISEEQIKRKSFDFGNQNINRQILPIIQSGQFSADKDEIFPIASKGGVVLLLGIGKQKEITGTSLRIAIRSAVLSSFLKRVSEIEIVPNSSDDNVAIAIIEAILLGTYKWDKYITVGKSLKNNLRKDFWIIAAPKAIYLEKIKICEGVNYTRDLVNENADAAISSFIERSVRNVIKGRRNISIQVLNRKELRAKGLNLHLAVNQASKNEPKLLIVKYSGASSKERYAAIIGKGVTFDAGGLNLKQTGHIENMKLDMGGAAAVIGTLKNTVALKLKKNIIFAIGLAENVIGPESYKPGEVIKSYDGKTVLISNTDAEGRLVLADAISYVIKNFRPKCIIDIATLTGSCIVALGYDYAGLMSNDDSLAEKILQSANATDDRAWRLPNYPELKDHLKSQIADIKNIGLPKGAAGTISGGEFLRQFAGGTKWAHLDIAGTSFVDGQDRMYFGHGATGSGVRLLTDYLKKN